jgi:hypothetical protein
MADMGMSEDIEDRIIDEYLRDPRRPQAIKDGINEPTIRSDMEELIARETMFDRKGRAINSSKLEILRSVPTYHAVKQEDVGPYFISTVWLGIEQNFFSWVEDRKNHRPTIFETMIFEWVCGRKVPAFDDYQERYATEIEALTGHQRAVEFVKQSISQKE